MLFQNLLFHVKIYFKFISYLTSRFSINFLLKMFKIKIEMRRTLTYGVRILTRLNEFK